VARPLFYRLDGRTPVPVPPGAGPPRGTWCLPNRVVGQDTLPDGTLVSTVFLVIDHQYGDGPPLLFETMVFPDPESGVESFCERYATWIEAEAGHAAVLAQLHASPPPPGGG
jgi:hypothetical protein